MCILTRVQRKTRNVFAHIFIPVIIHVDLVQVVYTLAKSIKILNKNEPKGIGGNWRVAHYKHSGLQFFNSKIKSCKVNLLLQ